MEEKAGCFAFIILQMYCYFKCSVVLPHGAVGWSECVIVVFPDLTHLLFDILTVKTIHSWPPFESLDSWVDPPGWS